MKKIFVFVASLFLLISIASAQDATVTYVKGKVEVQRNGKWLPLASGDSVAINEVINTGFQSEAKIKVIDSVMYLGPVTRITLEELSASDSQDSVNVYLTTGSVRSKVNHTETKRVNYTVHTPVAVASVRGTDWWITSNNDVYCSDGGIAVASLKFLKASGINISLITDSVELTSGGIVIRKNQGAKVSDSILPPLPVNKILKASNDLLSSVSSAAKKDAAENGGDVSKFGKSVEKNEIPVASFAVKLAF